MPSSDSHDSNPTRVLYSIWLCVALVWGTNVMLQRHHLRDDVDAYLQFGRNVGETHTLARTLPGGRPCPSAHRPPLYPFLLAITGRFDQVGPAQVALLHLACVLGIATLTYDLARQLKLPAAWAVGLVTVFDPLLLHWSTYPMTETLATLLALLVVVVGLRWHETYRFSPGVYHDAVRSHRAGTRSSIHYAGMWGAVLGFATLCRPVFLPWGLLLAGGLLAYRPRAIASRQAAALLLGLVIVLTPWALRNRRLVGVTTPLTTHGGYTLLLSNNPAYYQHLKTRGWREPWDARELQPLLEQAGLSVPRECQPFEAAYDQGCRRLALKSIQAQPGMFLYATAVRVVQLWSPLPHATSNPESPARRAVRYAVGLWYLVLSIAAILGVRRAWRVQREITWIGLAGCLAFTLVHAVYFSNMRMRTPLMPWIYLMAAVALVHWKTPHSLTPPPQGSSLSTE